MNKIGIFLLKRGLFFFKKDFFSQDFLAGWVVSCVSLPLSIALALASGVPPVLGIISAVVGGTLCSFLGAVSLSVSGPGNTLVLFLFSLTQVHGFEMLPGLVFMCGLLQFFSGKLGLGKMIHHLPSSFLEGVTAGMGVLIFISGFPLLCGLPRIPQETTVSLLLRLAHSFPIFSFWSLLLGLGSLSLVLFCSIKWPRFPISLFLTIFATTAVFYFQLPVSLLGPTSLFIPGIQLDRLWILPWPIWWKNVALFYFFASFETLLSARVCLLEEGKKRTSAISIANLFNREWMAQGIGNMAVSFLGGLPVVGAIGRSALNMQVGAKTFRASFFSALLILFWLGIFSSWIEKIPHPVLAGIVMSVGLRMFQWKRFFHFSKFHQLHRIDNLHYLITFLVTLLADLSTGIEIGLLLALIIFGIRKFLPQVR